MKLAWDDFVSFIARTAHSGVKGLALLFAALLGIGAVLVEANIISALILLGSARGFAFSLAMKNDKGDVLSAALLLFGVMTIWLPPVRNALFLFPLATTSVLILLALTFKFAQTAGAFGMMTGGVLALYVIFVVIEDTSRQPARVAAAPQAPSAIALAPIDTAKPVLPPAPTASASPPGGSPEATAPLSGSQPSSASGLSQARKLPASQGAILKFVPGAPYHLKVPTGLTTSLRATQGRVAIASNDADINACLDKLDFPALSGPGPCRKIEPAFRGCGQHAILIVKSIR